MKLVGIDLGWNSQPTGLCCLAWQQGKLHLRALDRKLSIAEILSWCDSLIANDEPALIAVDAPTLIPNTTGMRRPDQLTHKYFGRYHAGCYPANRNRPFAKRTIAFGLHLEERGFSHAPTMIPQQTGRYQIEVYPHTAMVNLFQLERILKYKKGRIAQRKAELAKLQQYIQAILPKLIPSLSLDPLLDSITGSLDQLTGTALKAIEDQLDSLICAYIGAHWWYWGESRNWVLGDHDHGYIIVPSPIVE